MPLKQGKSNAVRSANIKREIDVGKKSSQAAAIAYRIQRDMRAREDKKRGGK